MEKEKIGNIKNYLKMASGRMHTPHPTPPGSLPGHKLQKLSRESDIFRSFGTINFFFLLKSRVKKNGGGHGTTPSPTYAPALGHQSILLMLI